MDARLGFSWKAMSNGRLIKKKWRHDMKAWNEGLMNGPRVFLWTNSMPIWHMLTWAKNPSAVETDKSESAVKIFDALFMPWNASCHFWIIIRMARSHEKRGDECSHTVCFNLPHISVVKWLWGMQHKWHVFLYCVGELTFSKWVYKGIICFMHQLEHHNSIHLKHTPEMTCRRL